MSDRVWMRCAEMLIREFPPYPFPRPIMAEIETHCGAGGEASIRRIRALHVKVKVIRQTSLWANLPGYRGLGDIEAMHARACAQWTEGVRYAESISEVYSESNARARQAAAIAAREGGSLPRGNWGGRRRRGELAWKRLVVIVGHRGEITIDELAEAMGIHYAKIAETRCRVKDLVKQAMAAGAAVRLVDDDRGAGHRKVCFCG